MRVLLLNQYGPSSGAPTGRILAELGDGLRACGHDVVLVETDPVYGASRRGLARILHELLSHARLAWRGWHCDPVDAVISLTSPVCLVVTAGFIARHHRARHFHWAMDLYPDTAVRLGELPDGMLARLLARLVGDAYRRADAVVALDADMHAYVRETYGIDSRVLPPFPPDVTWPQLPLEPERDWLYAGNFGRGHEIDVLLQVQKRLEERNVDANLVLQGQGAQFDSSRIVAAKLGLQRVTWRPPVELGALGESLARAGVLVVTRKSEMKGLLLPSKLTLAEISGRPILWIGDTDGETTRRLSQEGQGAFCAREVEAMAEWLQKVFAHLPTSRPPAPDATRTLREESIRQWDSLLRS